MGNQIGYKLGLMKRFLLSFAGLLVLGIPLALGIINAPTSQAHSFDNDKPDILKTYSKAERSEEPSGTVSGEQDQSSLPVNANTMIQTAVNHEKKAVSFKAVPKTASKDNESSIVPAKREVHVRVASSDSGSKDVKLKTEDAKEFISRGISSLKKGQLEDAVSEFSSAVNLDPGKALTYVARGSAYFRLGRFDKALSDYNRAIEIDPDLAVAYQNRGSVYYRQGQLDKAISDYNRAIKINPDFADAYVDRGNIYQSQGRFDDAISDFSKVLKLYPKSALIHYFMGKAYYMKKQFDNAISHFSNAIDANPKFAVAYQDRGSAYSIKGDYDKAISDYDKAIELDPKNALTYASRGNTYFMLNQFDNAISDYNKAIELDPEMGKINGAKKIECRIIVSTGSTLKKEICLTKSQWRIKEKVLTGPNNNVSTYNNFLYTLKMYVNE